jgi:DNA-binding NtrC family response regulator
MGSMPARVVVVHDEPEFVDEMATALRSADHPVDTFSNPLAAWDALEGARQTEVLITRVQFQPGRSNGIALAWMARANRPAIRVPFTALLQYASDADGLGTFMPMPVHVPGVAETVTRLLKGDGEKSD